MPKKLVDCVKKVQAKGHTKSSAYGICVASTGLKPHKRSSSKSSKKGKR